LQQEKQTSKNAVKFVLETLNSVSSNIPFGSILGGVLQPLLAVTVRIEVSLPSFIISVGCHLYPANFRKCRRAFATGCVHTGYHSDLGIGQAERRPGERSQAVCKTSSHAVPHLTSAENCVPSRRI
jgi:hypothetical protein